MATRGVIALGQRGQSREGDWYPGPTDLSGISLRLSSHRRLSFFSAGPGLLGCLLISVCHTHEARCARTFSTAWAVTAFLRPPYPLDFTFLGFFPSQDKVIFPVASLRLNRGMPGGMRVHGYRLYGLTSDIHRPELVHFEAGDLCVSGRPLSPRLVRPKSPPSQRKRKPRGQRS